jgi:hypothetical protein
VSDLNKSSRDRPGRGLLGWLGRQVGYVKEAVQHDPDRIARATQVEERRDPTRPDLVFRRTTTDEIRRNRPEKP